MKYEDSKLAKFRKQYRVYSRSHPSKNKFLPLEKHAHHQVEIREVRGTKHYGKYWCLDCDKWIAWISKSECDTAKSLGLVKEDPIKNINARDLLG